MFLNVDILFRIAGIGILISVLCIVLKQAQKQEQAEMLTLAGVVVCADHRGAIDESAFTRWYEPYLISECGQRGGSFGDNTNRGVGPDGNGISAHPAAGETGYGGAVEHCFQYLHLPHDDG
jgi:hypothetical protein